MIANTIYSSPAWALGKFTLSYIFRLVLYLLIGSIFFDVVHWLAHSPIRTRYRLLRWIARAHATHHQFFDHTLRYNQAFRRRNIQGHLIPELACHLIGTATSWISLSGSIQELGLSFLLIASRTAYVAWNSGFDSNHEEYDRLPKDRWTIFVGPEYHCLHHMDPLNFFASSVRLIDWVLGTASSLRGRRVTITGGSEGLGQALVEELATHHVKSVTHMRHVVDSCPDDCSPFYSVLSDTDILILAHGFKSTDGTSSAIFQSSIAMIEAFKASSSRTKLGMLREVWYIGSEAEIHGSWSDYVASKQEFAPFARAYYDDESFIYRHIFPAVFTSSMGSGVLNDRWAARIAVWWILRGARYIPLTYTGLAFASYFRFMYWTRPRSV